MFRQLRKSSPQPITVFSHHHDSSGICGAYDYCQHRCFIQVTDACCMPKPIFLPFSDFHWHSCQTLNINFSEQEGTSVEIHKQKLANSEVCHLILSPAVSRPNSFDLKGRRDSYCSRATEPADLIKADISSATVGELIDTAVEEMSACEMEPKVEVCRKHDWDPQILMSSVVSGGQNWTNTSTIWNEVQVWRWKLWYWQGEWRLPSSKTFSPTCPKLSGNSYRYGPGEWKTHLKKPLVWRVPKYQTTHSSGLLKGVNYCLLFIIAMCADYFQALIVAESDSPPLGNH